MTSLQEFYLELDNIEKQSSTGLISIKDIKRSIGYFYLKKEKQQIIDAYDLGSLSELQYPDKNAIQNGEEYFKETYNK